MSSDDETIDTSDEGLDIGEYLGEEITDPLNRAIDARIAAAAKPQQSGEPLSEAGREALDDRVLDSILDGDPVEAERLSAQQRQSPKQAPEGDGYISNHPGLRVPRGTVGGPL